MELLYKYSLLSDCNTKQCLNVNNIISKKSKKFRTKFTMYAIVLNGIIANVNYIQPNYSKMNVCKFIEGIN